MSANSPSAEQVEAVLAGAVGKYPADSELLPVFNFLLPTVELPLSNEATSSSTPSSSRISVHLYCSKCLSATHREGAVYLLFSFAFKRDGMAKRFLQALEKSLNGCVSCARAFGSAKKTFGSKYLAFLPPETRKNFFRALEDWQSTLILDVLKSDSADSDIPPTLFSLPAPTIQLLFSEPNLLGNTEIAASLDNAITTHYSSAQPTITSYGLSPILIRLLASPRAKRRTWALSQLPACSRRPMSFEQWCESGVGVQVQALYTGSGEVGQADRLGAMEALLRSDALSTEAIEKGLIEGKLDKDGDEHGQGGFISMLSHLLGSPSQHYQVILNCFALMLSACPKPTVWTFDTSPELPHTLFSEIKDNTSFQDVVIAYYQDRAAAVPTDVDDSSSAATKGKGKEADSETPLSWVSDLLRSLVPGKEQTNKREKESALPQALAKAMSFCFAEMQHERLSENVKAASAKCGFDALADLRICLPDNDKVLQNAYASTLQVHAKYIAGIALRSTDRPVTWTPARLSAQSLLEQCFTGDGRDIVESMLGLAQIAFTEKRRLKRAKSRSGAPDAQPVTTLHRASVHGELWRMAYENVGTADVTGVSIFLKTISTFSHVELLDRREAWKGSALQAVVKEEDWVNSVRAVNHGLRNSREGFAHALESLAMQPDTALTRTLWDIPGVPKSAIILLLSPIDEIHEPVTSLIQQAFTDADDRLECLRVLLQRYPDQAMDGLRSFLRNFIQTAQKTPDSCSLAKWLVRCFTDVIEVLCNPSSSEPLLHDETFLTNHAGDMSMSKRVGDLWQLMTESLAVIFDRTKDWAPLYENDVMVDWMRDALIFGRNMTEHIRVFEAAFLGQSGSRFSGDDVESPAKITHVGKRMVEKLEKVLKHLVSWLRLTDIETLHQTFELIKTIVGRIAKAKPDLTKTPDLEATLQDIDKFSRRADSNHRTRLSDDYLSELASLLDPFDLGLNDDEVQFLREQKTAEPSSKSSRDGDFKPLPPARPESTLVNAVTKRNAFEEMMKTAGKGKVSSKTPSSSQTSTTAKQPTKTTTSTSSRAKEKTIDVDDDEFDDGWLEELPAGDLDIIEKRAKVDLNTPKAVIPKPGTLAHALTTRHQPTSGAAKLNINVAPRRPIPTKPSAPSFKTKFMQELRKEHRIGQAERARAPVGGGIAKLSGASAIGSGLGAYTGPPRSIKRMEDSGSSASESSDEDNSGLKEMAKRQKSPVKRFTIEPAARGIKVIGNAMDDVMRQREERRNAQHRTKQRLRPDISDLHRFVLSMDPQHIGPTPPHHAQYAAQTSKLGPVPSTFPSAKQYEQVMLPLFLQELWAQSQQEKPSDTPMVVEVASRQYDDGFVDIDVFSKQMYASFVNDSDIVILSQPGQTGRTVLAKVQAFKKKQNVATIKLRVSTLMDRNLVVPKTTWHMTKHFSLSTAIREFGALKGLPYYEPELLSDILAGRAARMPRLTSSAIDDAMQAYSVNEPQAKAILGAMESKGFALIQGPPGTGKTKTISGLVGKFLSERRTPIPTDGQKAIKPKLLVCAPSNAAIDEVCKRLLNGVPSSKGNRLSPTIVRIGIEKSVNISVKEVSLDSLVEAAVSASSSHGVGNDYTRIQAKQAELKDRISEKQNQIALVQDFDDRKRTLESELHALSAEKIALVKDASRARDAVKDASRHLDGARRAARDAILQDADIICATLSGSGHESLAPYTFETVIIDEAAQAIEMSCLIPLKYGCQRCIMVGDPNQLPPTTISQELERFHYNESLFVRIAKRDKANMHLLSIQYRMHPFISELPSKVFYDGQLKDGEDMAEKTHAVWHQRNVYGPYRFFNVEGIEQKRGTSTYNPAEGAAAVDLYMGLERDFGQKVNLSLRVGVISMYKEQVGELRRAFTRQYGEDILQKVEFNTVDGFQGQEKDIIILSTVRSGSAPTIGFLRDARRMNVALTRAKSSLFVIGNARTLERGDERWKTIVGDARDRGFLIDYDNKTFVSAPLDTPPVLPKPKIKREKLDRIKVKSENNEVTHISKQVNSVSAPTRPVTSANSAQTTTSSAPIEGQKDRAVPPKVTPAKRVSDISAASIVRPDAKKPNLNGTATPKASSVSSTTSTNGTAQPTVPKGLPRPGPAPAPVVANGTAPAASSNGARPPPPPGRPPPPPGRPTAPPAAPARAAEDVLFIKKKKKKGGPSAPPPPPGSSSVKDRYK